MSYPLNCFQILSSNAFMYTSMHTCYKRFCLFQYTLFPLKVAMLLQTHQIWIIIYMIKVPINLNYLISQSLVWLIWVFFRWFLMFGTNKKWAMFLAIITNYNSLSVSRSHTHACALHITLNILVISLLFCISFVRYILGP